jgi:hypothetical protein
MRSWAVAATKFDEPGRASDTRLLRLTRRNPRARSPSAQSAGTRSRIPNVQHFDPLANACPKRKLRAAPPPCAAHRGWGVRPLAKLRPLPALEAAVTRVTLGSYWRSVARERRRDGLPPRRAQWPLRPRARANENEGRQEARSSRSERASTGRWGQPNRPAPCEAGIGEVPFRPQPRSHEVKPSLRILVAKRAVHQAHSRVVLRARSHLHLGRVEMEISTLLAFL